MAKEKTVDYMEQSLEMMKGWTESQRKMWEGWMSTTADLGAQQNPMSDWMAKWQETSQQSLAAWEDLVRKTVEGQGKYASSDAFAKAWPGAEEDVKRMAQTWTEQTLSMMTAWTDAQRKLWDDWFSAATQAAKAPGTAGPGDWFARWQESAKASVAAWEELSRKTMETQASWQKAAGKPAGSDTAAAGPGKGA